MNNDEEKNPFNEQNELDRQTLKLLDKVCEGVEVPSDEECNAAAAAHGDSEKN